MPRAVATGLGFLFVFGLYLQRLHDTLSLGDGPELVAAMASLGVAHPPGYPLWTELGWWTWWLPLGSGLWRANAFSAVMQAVTVVLLGRFAAGADHRDGWRDLTATCWIGVTSLWAPVWLEHAVAAEVYPLGHALLAAMLLAASAALHQGSRRSLSLAWLAFGLGLANHHTAALFGPWLLVLTVVQAVRYRWRWLSTTLWSLPGLSVYLHLPLRARSEAALTWGDPEGWSAVWRHIRRAEYGALPQGQRTLTDLLEQIHALSVGTAGELPVVVLVLAGVGAGLWAYRDWRRCLVVVLALVTIPIGILAFIDFTRSPVELYAIERFLLFGTILLVAAAVAPLVAFQSVAAKVGSHPGVRHLAGCVAVALAVTVGLTATPVGPRESPLLLPVNRLALRTLPHGATVIAQGDADLFPLVYLQIVERVRPDVRLIDPSGQLDPTSPFQPTFCFSSHLAWAQDYRQTLSELSVANNPLYLTFMALPEHGTNGFFYADPEDLARLRPRFHAWAAVPSLDLRPESPGFLCAEAVNLGLRELARRRQAGRPTLDLEVFLQSIARDNTHFWFSEALHARQRGDFETAERYLRASLDAFPRNDAALDLLVEVYELQGRFDAVAPLRERLRAVRANIYRGEECR